ncbi:MAG: L-threonylcarbamoyladenylate synthase [Cyanobacteria bacterium P01_B01_bin.77]
MPYASLQDYVQAALSGEVVALPTDTVWGVAVTPGHSASLYTLKQRSLEKSLILLGAQAADLWPYVTMDMTQWQTMTDRHWPGQLTLVVPASPNVPLAMHPTTPGTIGVRVPDHPVARQILALTGPLATTSANVSGQPNLSSVEQVLNQFPSVYGLDNSAFQALFEQLAHQQEGIPSPSGLPSTVARWQLGHWEILRQGTVYL